MQFLVGAILGGSFGFLMAALVVANKEGEG